MVEDRSARMASQRDECWGVESFCPMKALSCDALVLLCLTYWDTRRPAPQVGIASPWGSWDYFEKELVCGWMGVSAFETLPLPRRLESRVDH